MDMVTLGRTGITNHRLSVAKEAIESGLYETLQFPFSYISGEQELELVQLCKEHEMGFIAMKGLSGGLITNSAAAYAFEAQFEFFKMKPPMQMSYTSPSSVISFTIYSWILRKPSFP